MQEKADCCRNAQRENEETNCYLILSIPKVDLQIVSFVRIASPIKLASFID